MDHGDVTGATYTYRFPPINRRFQSKFHNVRNLELSGGGPWRRLMGRVADGLKPIAFFDAPVRRPGFRGDGDMRAAARFAVARDLGLRYELHTFDGPDDGCAPQPARFVSVSHAGRVGQLFDLVSLARDYVDYLDIAGSGGSAACRDIARELARIQRRPLSSFLEFEEVESDFSPGGYARCGLLLGYPPDTTVAIILGDLLKVAPYGGTRTVESLGAEMRISSEGPDQPLDAQFCPAHAALANSPKLLSAGMAKR